ncbi:MAG: hypothetical protein LBQ31_06410 [Bacteroidales bacterium]|jgi:cell division protein FtsL|nr:hypothetical protein [Bacteroidales bacterium]
MTKDKKDRKTNFNNILDGSVVVRDLFQKNRLLLVIIFFMSLFLIWNNHYTESTIKKINRYQKDIEELNYIRLSTENELTYISRPSSVARTLEKTGITESKIPPTKIMIVQPK